LVTLSRESQLPSYPATHAPRVALSAAALLAIVLAAYLPDLGHGFIRDDFRWIREGRSESLSQLLDLFTTNVGFYRPLVSISFAADHALWGLEPFGYGLTNLALLLIDAALLGALARRLGLPAAAAVLAAAVFTLNFHGVNMAVLWLSGRTSLLALLFALSAAQAMLRGYGLAAGLLCLAALLSKEEALGLPAVLTLFLWLDGRRPVQAWPLWAALAVYALLRGSSGAFTPGDAPVYYQFSVAPSLLLRNIGEYADRAATASAAVSLLLLAMAPRMRPWFNDDERRALVFAALWIPAMYALTVLLPIRSSLYALIPSAGCALAAGACASRAIRFSPRRFARAAVALVVIAALLVPVYRSRNHRWVQPADLSMQVMAAVQATTTSFPAGGRVVLVDAPDADVGLDDAFAGLFPDALALFSGDMWTGQIEQPGAALPVDQQTTIVFELRGGTLEPISVTRLGSR
jgi:hypothetical protein